MAAEHESRRADGRGDQPAALPPAGAHARPRPRPRRRLRSPVTHAPSHVDRLPREDCRAAHRRAEQGIPGRAGRRACCASAGYRQRRDSRELVLADPENDAEFFFLRPRDIAVYVGAGHPRRRDHRARPAARLAARGRRDRRARASASRRSGSPARPGAVDRLADLAGTPDRDELRGPGRAVPRRARRRGRRSSGSTAPSRPPCGSGVADVDRRRGRDRDDAAQRRAGGLRRPDPAVRGGARAPASVRPTTRPRSTLVRRLQGVLVARQYVLMDYDVRVELVEKAVA